MLYIMRHGRTDWNERNKLQGRTDIPLNANGRQMAEKAREEYADVHFDVCYCSPLIRARETAEIVLRGRNIPIIPDERLVEMSFGACEGMEYSFDKPGSPIADLFCTPRNTPSRWTAARALSSSLPEPGSSCGKWLTRS